MDDRIGDDVSKGVSEIPTKRSTPRTSITDITQAHTTGQEGAIFNLPPNKKNISHLTQFAPGGHSQDPGCHMGHFGIHSMFLA